jgi:hypothetical protein
MHLDESVSQPGFAAQLSALQENVTEIKTALLRLSDAVTKLALVEERQTQASLAIDRAFSAIERIEQRLSTVERDMSLGKNQQAAASLWIDRAVVFLVTAALMFIARNTGLM